MYKLTQSVSVIFASATISIGVSLSASAATFPDKPVHLIVPFSPGGGTDILARTIAPKLAEVLGQPVIIENKAGAGGNIGAARVVESKPDGYTLLFGSNTLSINASLYKTLSFDTIKDLDSVGLIATAPLVLVVNPSTGIKSVRELIDKSHANPGTLNWSTPGAGTPHHLAMALFNKKTGANLTQVQYKGGGPAITDLVGNHTQASVLTLASVASYIEAGRLTALGVATTNRTNLMPDVPTVAEAGVEGYSANLWYGLFVPAKTPAEIVNTLNAALNEALKSADLRETLRRQGYETQSGTPEQLHEMLVNDVESSGQTIADANIQTID
ncbi:tripartite tricarboxylate transporter substrate binding protein [Pusillimonas sp. ANT_WB101]|uniref:Bug family tripartite tricarboxylate transporter substrate binding protein n=1 Tax=Pusillimonas sp. ANT_WB101 TaxID=2597356 RepID=UPI0011EDABA6|nr:tripartite tricarboxylate transporter substrate binding protein [Pusillimonas sp. ANT_WB101]KAA0892803.1 tripartite tricarboxylate transporter substrate binding protein [Pusillimonas sp. ANT_WB101]